MWKFWALGLAILVVGCRNDADIAGKPLGQWRQALKDPSPKIRREAAVALGKAGTQSKGAVPDLAAALKDSDDGVRIQSANALWSISADAAGAVPELTAALKDKNAEVRLNAAGALGEMGSSAGSAVSELA